MGNVMTILVPTVSIIVLPMALIDVQIIYLDV